MVQDLSSLSYAISSQVFNLSYFTVIQLPHHPSQFKSLPQLNISTLQDQIIKMRFYLPLPPTLPLITLSLALFTAQVSARDVPPNIQALYNNVRKAGNCKNILKTGFYAKDDPPNSKSTLIFSLYLEEDPGSLRGRKEIESGFG